MLSLWGAYIDFIIQVNQNVEFLSILRLLVPRSIVILLVVLVISYVFNTVREMFLNSASEAYLIENLIYLTSYFSTRL